MKKVLEKQDINRNSFIFFIIGIIIMFVFSIFDVGGCEQQVIDDYNKFNQANINGILKRKSSSAGRVFIQLNETKEEYAFWPVSGPIEEVVRFSKLAKIGDSIVKPAFSDRLTLISNEKKYHYYFKKYHASTN